ncbi:hypothetical protein, conserved [Eimeria brunetti]|uniref:Uncharacterized protein n=1 Tax=Eimeria brunetti TaxID=51314 RepID=U6LRR9_9EIME|nr:hypothetical protein, conserved [Eimeria brunetti]
MGNCHRVAAFLGEITSKLKALAPGAAAFIPAGVRLDEEMAPVHMLFVVYRHPDSSSSSSSSSSGGGGAAAAAAAAAAGAVEGGTGDYLETEASRRRHFTVALVNSSGFGQEYHAFAVEKCPSPGRV